MKSIISFLILFNSLLSFEKIQANPVTTKGEQPGIQKIKDVIIYKDTSFFSSFPSVIKRPDGELIVAFRRAPDRRIYGAKGNYHVDANSYLVKVSSTDAENWTKEPELIYAHAFGGSQDPCMLQLKDGTILCASYGWTILREDERKSTPEKPMAESGGHTFLGGYLVRSMDGGNTWQGPIYPPHVSEVFYTPTGIPLPAYNRGALCEDKNGRIFWVIAAHDREEPRKTSTHLLASDDKGLTWKYMSEVASDEKASFNETSIYETPKGDLVAFLRTAGLEDQACIARSKDGGKTFGPWQKMGFQGHPLNALRLPDNRVLLTYGYRHEPFGIRARILNAECTDFATAPEIVLRDDGGSTDLGYTWPVLLDDNRALVVYYFNKNKGTRYIAGTIIEIEP
ncbi:MAG: sialidase family protein [Draconibacterium sp.]